MSFFILEVRFACVMCVWVKFNKIKSGASTALVFVISFCARMFFPLLSLPFPFSKSSQSPQTGKTPLLLATRGSYISLVDMIIKSERFHERKRQMASVNARQSTFKPNSSADAYPHPPVSDEEDLDGEDEELDREALAEADRFDGAPLSGSFPRSGLHNGSVSKNGSLGRTRGSSAPGTNRTPYGSGRTTSRTSRPPSLAGSRLSRPPSVAGSRVSRADSVSTVPMSMYGAPEDHRWGGVWGGMFYTAACWLGRTLQAYRQRSINSYSFF